MNILLFGRSVTIFLCLVTAIMPSCNTSTSTKKYAELSSQDYKHEIDTVDGDTIYYKAATLTDVPQKIVSLNSDQKLFVKYCLLGADSIIRKRLSNKNVANFTPVSLDEIIDKWNEDSLQFHCTKEHFVNCIGVAFGDYLVRTYKMEWKIVTDEVGSDYATAIEKIKLTNFPISSVLKAVEQKRGGSLTTISLITKRDIMQLGKDNVHLQEN